MRAALALFRDSTPRAAGIVVSGDMAELGDESAAAALAIGQARSCDVAGRAVDRLRAVRAARRGRGAFRRDAGLRRDLLAENVEEALPHWARPILPGDVVLVKGSRAMAMERLVEALAAYPRRRVA